MPSFIVVASLKRMFIYHSSSSDAYEGKGSFFSLPNIFIMVLHIGKCDFFSDTKLPCLGNSNEISSAGIQYHSKFFNSSWIFGQDACSNRTSRGKLLQNLMQGYDTIAENFTGERTTKPSYIPLYCRSIISH